MKKILLVFLSAAGIVSAFAVSTTNLYQCPNVQDLKSEALKTVENPNTTIYAALNSGMQSDIEKASQNSIVFFNSVKDRGIMRCVYSSDQQMLMLSTKQQLAKTIFVNASQPSCNSSAATCVFLINQ